MFEETKLSLIFYIIVVVIGLFVLFVIGAYLFWNYYLGKSMSPFFWLRIKSWTQKGVALFEIFSLTNSISLEEARKETGDGYRLYTPTVVNVPVKKSGKLNSIFKGIMAKILKTPVESETKEDPDYGIKKVKRVQNLIMPKSTYSINSVNTIPLWDLHPQLHTDILEGVKTLVDNGIGTLKELEEFVSNPEDANEILFKNYTYRTFLDLYLGARQKFYVNVTTDDVANFIGANFDKNFRESIEAKDFNSAMQSKTDNSYLKWGYLAIIITILIVGFIKIYNTIWG